MTAQWIIWKGGRQPERGDRKADIRFRNGEIVKRATRIKDWDWAHHGSDYDIIAYRIVEPSHD